MITFGTWCSGIEAASEAWLPLGWQCAYVAEIEPFPCAYLAQRHGAGRPRYMPRPEDAETLAEVRHRRAMMKALDRVEWGDRLTNYGDISQIDPRELPAVDILGAGFPCFPAGARIATRRGFVPIEQIATGDEVLTHKGRFRRVLQIGSKRAQTVTIRGQGHHGVRTTPNHPFLAREKWAQSTRRGGRAVRITGVTDPAWVEAAAIKGKFWACVADWPELPVPPVTLAGGETRSFPLCEDLFRLVGAYLGDGWAHEDARRGSVRFGLNDAKLAALRATFDALGAYAANRERTVIKVSIPSRALARWLATHFGAGATGKRVPMWALGMPAAWRRALLEGYLLTDGTDAGTSGRKALTVSEDLALTFRMLANSLGYASSVSFHKTPDTHVIEGRTVNQRDYYRVTASPSSRSSFADAGIRWQLVRSVDPTEQEEVVYDLTVEEDHSYTVDGLIVHNCQDFSIAGLRASLGGGRGNLSITGVRLLLELAELGLVRGALLEQVPDVLNTADNAWGNILGALVGAGDPLQGLEHGGKWPRAGMVAGPRARAAWRILDAQHFGLAQRRERVWAVVDFGDGPDPAAVLFERQGVPGHPPSSREPREDLAGTLASGARGRGGYSYDDIPQVAAFGGNRTGGGVDVHTALSACHTASGRQDFETETFLVEHGPIALSCKDHGADAGALSPTLRAMGHARSHPNAGGQVAVAYGIASDALDRSGEGSGGTAGERSGLGITEELAPTLKAKGPCAVAFSLRGRDGGAMPEVEGGDVAPALRSASGGSTRPFVAFDETQITSKTNRSNPQPGAPCHPLTAKGRPPTLAWSIMPPNSGKDYKARQVEVLQPVMAGRPVGGNQGGDYIQTGMAVRRITCVEAERLQGFPDNSTLIDWPMANRKDDDLEETVAYLRAHGFGDNEARALAATPDGPRYKAIGNSWPTHVARWLGERIQTSLIARSNAA